VNGELFDVNVLEIGTWNTNITDTASDVSSHLKANHLDKDDISVEDKENNNLDNIDGILKDLDNNAKNEENQVEEDILKQPEEECIKVSESLNLSRPPGFKNIKQTLTNNSKCSTNFTRNHKKDIKGISLIHELNKIIKVGTTLGYDVRGCKRSLNRMINGIVQESKMARLELFRLKSLWGNINFNYACSMARGHWNNEVGDCFMINIYGPQESTAKSSLWNRLAEFMNQHNGKFILFGDLNTILHEYERSGIDSTGLIDLPIGGRHFTWMNKAGKKLSKLDRFLISEGVMEDKPDIKVTAIERLWFDHSPILLHSKKADFGPSPFKLYNSWLSRDGFDDIVDVRKIDKSHKSANLSEIHDIEKKIDDGSASIFDREKRIKHLQDIDKLENLEALDLIQKARIKWDIEGNENSFFHGIINSKRRTQAIA
nr:RNA-directed DNA polymerase, eukaryota, reverse transcriptase zinc-binding domain protein [Tanacetum cinerariifolium]